MVDLRNVVLLIAEDDPEDRMLTEEALEDAGMGEQIHFVGDGEELLEFLKRQGQYKNLQGAALPRLILLDLNMPRMDGREALKEIKAEAGLRHIPVIAFTTSKAEEDILKTYDLGVASFITKPVTYEALVNVMKTVDNYWFHTVNLPS